MSTATYRGSCLCGAVKYVITGTPDRFYHCHCGRCRKATGTGHATNILLQLDTVEWPAGESLLGYYKVPDAERFATSFCRQCGSPMPRIVPALGRAVIPAGTLDSDPVLQPQARIFMASRASWSCAGGDLPAYDEYPT